MEEDSARETTEQPCKDSDRQLRLRLCVLNELLNTERDYVRTLAFLQSVSLPLLLDVCFAFMETLPGCNTEH